MRHLKKTIAVLGKETKRVRKLLLRSALCSVCIKQARKAASPLYGIADAALTWTTNQGGYCVVLEASAGLDSQKRLVRLSLFVSARQGPTHRPINIEHSAPPQWT